jgi:WD40 repeat protein
MVEAWNVSIAGIADLSIADDGSRVIAGTDTGKAMVFDQDGARLWEVRVPGTVLVGCLQNGSSFLVASREGVENNKGSLRLYDGTGNQVWYRSIGWPVAVDFCGSTGRILSGDRAGTLQVINRSGGEEAGFNDFPKSYPVAALALSGDGKHFAYSLVERNTQVRYITISGGSKKVFRNPFAHTGVYADNEPVHAIALSRDGARIATAGGEGSSGSLRLYARNGTELWSKKTGTITGLTLSPDGSCVCIATSNGTVSCYTQSGNLSWEYSSPSGITSISYRSNLLAAGTLDGDLFLFNESGTLLWYYRLAGFPAGTVLRVELSENALVVLSNDRSIHYFVKEGVPDFLAEPAWPPENSTLPVKMEELPALPDEDEARCTLLCLPLPWDSPPGTTIPVESLSFPSFSQNRTTDINESTAFYCEA